MFFKDRECIVMPRKHLLINDLDLYSGKKGLHPDLIAVPSSFSKNDSVLWNDKFAFYCFNCRLLILWWVFFLSWIRFHHVLTHVDFVF